MIARKYFKNFIKVILSIEVGVLAILLEFWMKY